tara:strand:+ start:975 stop:2339 length:1365 start_codon:yes stop_codon:yes gene_type:complete
MTTTAAIEGQMGEYKYYQTTMKTSDVISKTAAAIDYFSPADWEEMGEIARVQREPDTKRIMSEIAPYLIRSQKRFFNSIVVLLDEKACDFKSLDKFPVNDPNGKPTTASKLLLPAYQNKAEQIGFLEINESKSMLILDGQHRMLALKKVMTQQNELREQFKKNNEDFDQYKNHRVENDDISVIFLKVPDLNEMRKIFEDLNTYAKRQSKDVEIFGSESNPWYKICQWFCGKDKVNKKITENFLKDFVQKKGTSLGERNLKLTTAAHLVSIIKFLTLPMKFKAQMQLDSISQKMDVASKLCISELNEFFEKVGIFHKILSGKDNSIIPDLRDPSNKDALLLKPMPQVALFKAIYFLKNNSDMDVDSIYRAANKIDYSYDQLDNQWKNLVIASGGNILTSGKVESLLSDMLVYFIAGKSKCEKLENGKEWLEQLLERYKEQLEDESISELPKPNLK